MRGRRRRAFLVSLACIASGCAPSAATVRAPDPRLAKRDQLLARLRAAGRDFDQAQSGFAAAATRHEAAKDDYQKKLTLAMASRKASGRELKNLEKNRGQLAQMIQDRDRVGEDLRKVFETLDAAQRKRNAAKQEMLTLEGTLWELEERLGGGRAAVLQRVASELEEVRKTGQALTATERVEREAEGAVIDKEVELAGMIGVDVKLRDEADQALDGLREKLEAAATAYVSAASADETARERFHQRVQQTLPPPLPSVKDAADQKARIRQAAEQRGAAGKLLDEQQNVIKTATIDRAAQTKQRIAFDSEIDRVVEAGLSRRVKEEVLAGLTAEAAAIAEARAAMHTEDTAALASRRAVSGIEAELDALAY